MDKRKFEGNDLKGIVLGYAPSNGIQLMDLEDIKENKLQIFFNRSRYLFLKSIVKPILINFGKFRFG